MRFTIDGQTVNAATGGRPFALERPAVVMVHGAGMNRTVWSLQARHLAHRGYALLAVDLPGHGGSAGAAPQSIEQAAGWLIGVMDAAGIEAAAIVGHSMGALIGLQAAARLGRRLWALALLGVAAPMKVHPALMKAAEAGDPAAIDMIVDWGYGPRGHIGANPAPGMWMAGGGARLLQGAGPGVLARDLAACAAYDGALAAAAEVRCPVKILMGEVDRMTPPASAEGLARAFAGAETTVLAGVGHMMMAEDPDAASDHLRSFLGATHP